MIVAPDTGVTKFFFVAALVVDNFAAISDEDTVDYATGLAAVDAALAEVAVDLGGVAHVDQTMGCTHTLSTL